MYFYCYHLILLDLYQNHFYSLYKFFHFIILYEVINYHFVLFLGLYMNLNLLYKTYFFNLKDCLLNQKHLFFNYIHNNFFQSCQ